MPSNHIHHIHSEVKDFQCGMPCWKLTNGDIFRVALRWRTLQQHFHRIATFNRQIWHCLSVRSQICHLSDIQADIGCIFKSWGPPAFTKRRVNILVKSNHQALGWNLVEDKLIQGPMRFQVSWMVHQHWPPARHSALKDDRAQSKESGQSHPSDTFLNWSSETCMLAWKIVKDCKIWKLRLREYANSPFVLPRCLQLFSS